MCHNIEERRLFKMIPNMIGFVNLLLLKINDYAKNFPNAPRTLLCFMPQPFFNGGVGAYSITLVGFTSGFYVQKILDLYFIQRYLIKSRSS